MINQLHNSKEIRDKFINNSTKIVSFGFNEPRTLSSPTPPSSEFSRHPHSSKSISKNTLYLENDELSKDFTQVSDYINSLIPETPIFGSNPTITPPLNINISIFSINTVTAIQPFFQYLFVWNDEIKQYEFPKKIINIAPESLSQTHNEKGNRNNIAEEEEEAFGGGGDDPIKSQIMNECIEYILDLFDLHSDFDNSVFDEMFKGFIWKEESKSIYVFFKISKNQINLPNDTNPPKWAILHEIMYKKYIDYETAPISPEIVELFKDTEQNSHPVASLNTLYVKNLTNTLLKIPIEFPLAMYLCQLSPNGEWENVEGEAEESDIELTSNFPPLGDFYYFTSDPLIRDPPGKVWKKYAVFLNLNNGEHAVEESYIVKDISTITPEQWENYGSKLNQDNVSTIWFKNKNTQLWAIKYPNQFTSYYRPFAK